MNSSDFGGRGLPCIYLAGFISPNVSSTQYRDMVTPTLARVGFKVLSPLCGKTKAQIDHHGSFEPNEIVQRDLMDIRRSCIVLAVIVRGDSPEMSFGTPCEIMYAYTRGIPVVFVTDDDKLGDHYWTKGLCCKVFKVEKSISYTYVLDKAVEYINHWFDPGEYI